MKLVFNPSQTDSVVYSDDGLMVAPGEWAYLDDDTYRRIDNLLNTRKLVEVEVPATMPSNIAPGAAAAMKRAIEDRQAPNVAESTDEDDTPSPVRNTGRSRNTTTKKKEA
ncbi:hypothetical protein BH789_gp028 [Gordonia phage GMA6]|uniref:Uncharacterized protein n=1 Tax=Gordonia phage GMA6 TaxID=1647285 RepID=A0A0K0NL41_9CAUD|nr:hypothetical protein BH789_gp028 [Gordonia phage GMA6]AKL88309.1 hypothetical protein GMA6_28 [Gordonia phage GMA6]